MFNLKVIYCLCDTNIGVESHTALLFIFVAALLFNCLSARVNVTFSAAFKDRHLKFLVNISVTYAQCTSRLYIIYACLSVMHQKMKRYFLRFQDFLGIFSLIFSLLSELNICSITHFICLSIICCASLLMDVVILAYLFFKSQK